MSFPGRTILGAATELRVFGWGIASAPIEDIVFYARDIDLRIGNNGLRDLTLIEGVSAFEQDLRAALGTALGGDPLNLGHGFDGIRVLSEERDPMILRERIRGSVVAVLRADPRVLSVQRVLIGEEIAAYAQGGVAATAPASRAGGLMQIEAVFRVASGAEVSLSLGPVLGGG